MTTAENIAAAREYFTDIRDRELAYIEAELRKLADIIATRPAGDTVCTAWEKKWAELNADREYFTSYYNAELANLDKHEAATA